MSMSRLCYLSYYFRTFPTGYYSVMLTVPVQLEHHYRKVLEEMVGTGIFSIINISDLDWIRTTPMKARYFDFSKGRWDFDWSAVTNERNKIPSGSSDPVRYDYEDLRILRKLQADATQSLGRISRELKMPYQQAYTHFGHIAERRQIALYRIVWPATGPKSQEELKAWQRHHAHMALQLQVRDCTKSESQALLNKMERLPFNLSNGGGDDTFFSEFAVPLEYYSETLQYLSEALQSSRERTEFYIADQTAARQFPIPTHLYDKETGTWSSRTGEVQGEFRKLVLTVKGT